MSHRRSIGSEARKLAIRLKVAALATVVMISALSPAFAQRTSNYPEGSIFLSSPTRGGARGSAVGGEPPISPLNPLDAPNAGNVWKPSNRDAGNLSSQRWQDYLEKRAAQHRAE
jgi:hypothetical protein